MKKIAYIILCIVLFLSACFKSNQLQNATTIKENSIPSGSDTLWIPVLVYHHITPVPKKGTSATKSLYIEPDWFEKHLQYLKNNGFTSIHFSDVADYFTYGEILPERPILITFDDGWKNFYNNAFPLLKKYEMTGTLFMIARSIGYGAYLTLDQLKEIRDQGIEIGSHSMTHPYLTKSKRTAWEITESKKVLEEKLGISVTTFAYPYGNWNIAIENLVKEAGYTSARLFTTGNGVTRENLFHIPVVRVYANVGLERWKSQMFEN